jgi:BON domain
MSAPSMTRTDEQIQRDVLEELKWDARVQPNEIGVAFTDGIVTLIGWVDSYTKRWAAEDAAKRVRGAPLPAASAQAPYPRDDCEAAVSGTRKDPFYGAQCAGSWR